MEELYFKVEGEFICDLARTMFWDDDRPYDACEELLLSCLGTDEISLDEKKVIAQEILEGKKKLIGINCFELVDDNENIRPITNKIKQLQDKLELKRIKEHMELNPLLYVDPYSTVKSLKAAKEYKQISTYEDAYRYFCFSELDFEYVDYQSETMCGLWLLNEPELVLKANEKAKDYDDDDFWNRIYEYIKDRGGSFRERNERYLGNLRIKESKRTEILRMEKEAKRLAKESFGSLKDRTQSEAESENEYKKDIDSMTYDDYANYLREMEPLDIEYDVRPDDITNFEGLIDQNGNFYSCSFGGHNLKAYNILRTYWDKFDFKKLIGVEVYSRTGVRKIHMDKALDVIVDAGWIAARSYPFCGYYLSHKDDISFRATREQKNTIWEALVKHDIKLADYSLIL
ncbi:hypothetical protein [Hungatella hathewayi]|uniref:hypothetical protein n=1 Tax=Hungatella hathewayi TaxID=154046 RepID=UPI00356329C1